MASTDIYRATDATAASGYSQKWTWSGWVKRSGISSEQGIFSNERTDNHVNSRFKLRFIASDVITWECKDSGGSDDSSFETNALFRDTSGWYHICFVYDTDNGTAADRLILYVNGVRQTFGSENQASSGFGTLWSSAMIHQVGRYDDNSGNSKYFNGSMSHIHLSYGYALAPTVFGETDSTTGEWKIKTSPSVTYGSQGYFILKDGNSLTDQSGESNDFTLSGGTLTNTEDNPSNVFATGNPLCYDMATLSQGNTTQTSSGWKSSVTTLGFNSGKFYCEGKIVTTASGTTRSVFGACTEGIYNQQASGEMGQINTSGNTSHGYSPNGGAVILNTSQIDTIATATANDIIRVALDLDNGFIYYGKNGVWENSGDPTSGATGTGGYAFPNTQGRVFFGNTTYGSTINSMNFGNGYFGTTAISSEGTNASNIGKFEYDVPTGFTALCTKGLNE